jgi:hypothetical protein
MRRFWYILVAMLTAAALLLSAGCQKKHLRDNPEEEEPDSGSEKPPVPQVQ